MKAVVISGGTGAIGAALATAAAHTGWATLVGYRDAARAATLVEQIRVGGGVAEALALPLDETAAPVLDGIDRARFEVQALVLCASPPPMVASFVKTTADDFARAFAVNVVAAHRLLAECWKRFFRARNGGHVLALSTAALGPPATPHLASYLVAKSGLETLLDAAVAELGAAGLRATVLRPGFTETPMLQAFPSLILDAARARAPFLQPAQVADAALRALDHPPADAAVRLVSL